MNGFIQINGGFYRQDDKGTLYSVSDKDTLNALKSGQIKYTVESNARPLSFTAPVDTTGDRRSLADAFGSPAPAPTSLPGTGATAAPTPTDFSSVLKKKLSEALTNYKGVTDVSGLESKRQELLRKQLLSAPYQDTSEAVLTGAQKLSLMRDQGSEYEPVIKSLEEQIAKAKSGDEESINAITKLASVANALGIDITGQGGGMQSSSGKEYSDYVKDEISRGNTPMSFNAYLDMDANRKRSVTNINNAGLSTQLTNTALKLSDDYEARSKDFYIVRDGYNRVVSAAKDPSAAGDIALIFSYMKTLDPNSVVRETEFATAENAGSVPERVRAQYNKVLDGTRLSQVQRDDFVDRSKRLYEAAKSQQDRIVAEFTTRAEQFGIPANLVVRETTANDSYTTPPASTSKVSQATQDIVKKNITFSPDGRVAYLPRSVWSTLGAEMDAVLKEAEADGVQLLIR